MDAAEEHLVPQLVTLGERLQRTCMQLQLLSSWRNCGLGKLEVDAAVKQQQLHAKRKREGVPQLISCSGVLWRRRSKCMYRKEESSADK